MKSFNFLWHLVTCLLNLYAGPGKTPGLYIAPSRNSYSGIMLFFLNIPDSSVGHTYLWGG
jgi:hypothetical protein